MATEKTAKTNTRVVVAGLIKREYDAIKKDRKIKPADRSAAIRGSLVGFNRASGYVDGILMKEADVKSYNMCNTYYSNNIYVLENKGLERPTKTRPWPSIAPKAVREAFGISDGVANKALEAAMKDYSGPAKPERKVAKATAEKVPSKKAATKKPTAKKPSKAKTEAPKDAPATAEKVDGAE